MERKYYLRGLGIGIAVTAIFMGIMSSGDKGMTDQEIIARAKELGMVENTVLSDMSDEAVVQPEQSAQAEEGKEAEQVKESAPAYRNDENVKSSEETSSDDDISPEESPEQEPGDPEDMESENTAPEDAGNEGTAPEADQSEENVRDMITSATVKTITVSSGDGSHTVAKKLADAGVVTSADNFDEFLCRNGYDKKLRTGTFSIPADASDEQIARIVTGAE